MKMDERRLDGNAAGGILGELFTFEVTTAEVSCAGCSSTYQVGALMVYTHEMGTIVRCPSCDNPIIRVARGPGRYWLDLRGARYLHVGEEQ
jgi:Zn finger protein HypA/HybF involved in hydrogenase expression